MDEFDLQVIDGTISSVIYSNIENGYSVVALGDTVVTGYLPGIVPGEKIVAEGCWKEHPSYGQQFNADVISRFLPEDADSIFKYLSSGIIKGLGESTAATIVNNFGDDSLRILEFEPERIADIKGISLKKANEFSRVFKEKTFFRRLLEFTGSYNIRPIIAMRLYKVYGLEAIDVVRDNPYVMTLPSVGGFFNEADSMALDMGYDYDSVFRIQSAAVFELKHNLNNGHCFIPLSSLVNAVSTLINVEQDKVENAVSKASDEERLVVETINNTTAVYLPELHQAEVYVAERLISMKDMVEIITGGPGTGKTTSIKKLLDKSDAIGIKTLLIAPTGRAAKRMSEVTGRDASTIHRLLGTEIGEDGEHVKFTHNEKNKLKCDAIIIDEASMVDILIMESLLRAVPDNARIVLVGDVDQLPPVGPGSIFRSMIDSEVFHTVKLTEIYRQSADSFIVKNAHLINKGEHPDFSVNKGDFFRLKRLDGETTIETVVDLCGNRIPNKMGINKEDIQVLSPTRKGELGTINLNKYLQAELNPAAPHKQEKTYIGVTYRVGDRVMQIRNDYDIIWHTEDYQIVGNGMFNGDVGYIVSIDTEDEMLTVDFDGKFASYSFASLNELEHAWAMTVHKAQGCEFKAVVLVLSGASKLLLRRTILYTAVTRARQLLILVGDDRVANEMIDNSKRDSRFTFLKYRLKNLAKA